MKTGSYTICALEVPVAPLQATETTSTTTIGDPEADFLWDSGRHRAISQD
jgi:hypothetical protein